MEVARALDYCRQVLYALAYAHDLGMVHRDLKPDNVVVQALPSQPEHLKVLDFGFVKFLPGSDLAPSVQLTRAGFTYGSPAYMSPEHATGGHVDGRSDLYAVGIMLYEMLTGERPFAGEINELLRHHLVTPVPRLAQIVPPLADRDDLQALVDRLLAKATAERFASAAEVLAAIEALPEGKGRALGSRQDGAPDSNGASGASGKQTTREVGSDALTVMRPMGEGMDPAELRARAEWGAFVSRVLTQWRRIAGFFRKLAEEQGPKALRMGERGYVSVRARLGTRVLRALSPLTAACKSAWARVQDALGRKPG